MARNSSRLIQPRSLDEIKNLLQQHKPELSEKWKVKSLVEIDDPKMGLLKFIALENYLSDLLGIKVDLVEKETLKPAIGRHVIEEVESI